MNKIYKVVWSKAKHCYVVTSELAKRQTKGCGARSLRMATVSLGVAASLLCSGAVLPVFGESVAEAARHEITTDTSISSDETSTYADGVKMNASNIALTITSTGKVKMIESAGYNKSNGRRCHERVRHRHASHPSRRRCSASCGQSHSRLL